MYTIGEFAKRVSVAVPLTRLVLTDERRYGSTLLLFYEVNAGKGGGT